MLLAVRKRRRGRVSSVTREQANARTINAIVATANGNDAHARIIIAQILGECATRENVDIVLGVYRRASEEKGKGK